MDADVGGAGVCVYKGVGSVPGSRVLPNLPITHAS